MRLPCLVITEYPAVSCDILRCCSNKNSPSDPPLGAGNVLARLDGREVDLVQAGGGRGRSGRRHPWIRFGRRGAVVARRGGGGRVVVSSSPHVTHDSLATSKDELHTGRRSDLARVGCRKAEIRQAESETLNEEEEEEAIVPAVSSSRSGRRRRNRRPAERRRGLDAAAALRRHESSLIRWGGSRNVVDGRSFWFSASPERTQVMSPCRRAENESSSSLHTTEENDRTVFAKKRTPPHVLSGVGKERGCAPPPRKSDGEVEGGARDSLGDGLPAGLPDLPASYILQYRTEKHRGGDCRETSHSMRAASRPPKT
jgi:hypothetical protein